MFTSFRPEASRTKASSGLTTPSGALEDMCAPRNTPGMQPISSDTVRPSTKSPYRMCPRAAAPTSGTACTRSVPKSSLPTSVGYMIISATMISEPDPTEVMPTTRPPTAPMIMVGIGRTLIGTPEGGSVMPAAARRAA